MKDTPQQHHIQSSDIWGARLLLRKKAERRFRRIGLGAIIFIFIFLIAMFGNLIFSSYHALTIYKLKVPLVVTKEAIGLKKDSSKESLVDADFSLFLGDTLAQLAAKKTLSEEERLDLSDLISPITVFQLPSFLEDHFDYFGKPFSIELTLADKEQSFLKAFSGHPWNAWQQAQKTEKSRQDFLDRYELTGSQLETLKVLDQKGFLKRAFHKDFFTQTNSRYPEVAGILGELVGSFLTIFITLCFSVPLSVLAGIYLEIYAPKNRLIDFFELNIGNLASIPSIIYGLLGLFLFINVFGIERSTPLVGGMVLALMVMPTIIVSTRSAIASVPSAYMEGALALGSSRMQATFHFVVPAALPGIITGIILGASRALGETAPLIMVGMVAFIANVPHHFLSPASTLSVLIYLWGDSPEASFLTLASCAILVLLFFVLCMNIASFWVRRYFSQPHV